MSKPVRIALDAMGGDFGPEVVIPGAALALERRPDTSFIFFGKQPVVAPLLDVHPKLAAQSTIQHTEIAIAMHTAYDDSYGGPAVYRALEQCAGGLEQLAAVGHCPVAA